MEYTEGMLFFNLAFHIFKISNLNTVLFSDWINQ